MGKNNFRQFEVIFKTRTTLTKEKTVSLLNILKGLFINPLSEEFRQPLDWQERGLINYGLIIQQPMDLMTVQQNLKKEMYHSIEDCLNDIELIFQNSRHYNRGTTWVEQLTEKCEKAFLKLVRNYLPGIRSTLDDDNKKTTKVKKIKQKQTIHPQKIPKRINNTDNPNQRNTKLQQLDDDTAIPTGNDKPSNQIKQTEQITQLRTQFFDLIKQSSQNSLQVAYLIIKAEDLTVINTERNGNYFIIEGNCRIDVKKLTEQTLIKLIGFLKEQKQREAYEKSKQNLAKKKRTLYEEKNRYDI